MLSSTTNCIVSQVVATRVRIMLGSAAAQHVAHCSRTFAVDVRCAVASPWLSIVHVHCGARLRLYGCMLEAASQAERCLLLVHRCGTCASMRQLCACMRGAWLVYAVPCCQQGVFGIALCCEEFSASVRGAPAVQS